ncbi:MAG: CopG family transcriptional regulator [Candidatus Dormibacteraceae bacterium]
MKMAKVSVAVPAGLVEEARRRVGSHSLSSYVTEGIWRQILADRQREFMTDWQEEFGPITGEERAEACKWPVG